MPRLARIPTRLEEHRKPQPVPRTLRGLGGSVREGYPTPLAVNFLVSVARFLGIGVQHPLTCRKAVWASGRYVARRREVVHTFICNHLFVYIDRTADGTAPTPAPPLLRCERGATAR